MKTRLALLIIDADGCVYNPNYDDRLLHCIFHYKYFLNRYRKKKKLPDRIIQRMMNEQESLVIKESEMPSIIIQLTVRAVKFYNAKCPVLSEEEKYKKYINRYIGLMQKLCPEVLGYIAVKANPVLISYIWNQIRGYGGAVVALGSNRQSKRIDSHNSERKLTGSIYFDLRYIVAHLNKIKAADAPEIKLDMFTTTDIHAKKPLGNTYQKIIENALEHDPGVFDQTKLSVLYSILHHVRVTEPLYERIDAIFIDDILRIIQASFAVFDAQRALLPESVMLQMKRYCQGIFHEYFGVKGTGIVDKFYPKNVRLMARLCNDKVKEDRNIDAAAQLNVEVFLSKRKVSDAESSPLLFARAITDKNPPEEKQETFRIKVDV